MKYFLCVDQCEYRVSGTDEESGQVTSRHGCSQHHQRTATTGTSRWPAQ